MPTTTNYLEQLQQDRENLVDNLEEKGIKGLVGDETFTELVPEILNVSDWSDVGYKTAPIFTDDIHNFARQVYEQWVPGTSTSIYDKGNELFVVCPLIDTSRLTRFNQFFQNSTYLTEIPAITVTNQINTLASMFTNCQALKKIDFSNFNTSNVTNMSKMFASCISLEELDLTNFNTSNLTNMETMFSACSNLREVDLSSFDVSNVSKFRNLFYNCVNLTTVNFGNNFDTSAVTTSFNFNNLFGGCTNLDNNTLNQILKICINATSLTENKNLAYLGITDSALLEIIPTLSNYQSFLNAGWTIS